MNLKAIKTKTQENIITTIKSMVGESVNVQASYDFEHETVTVLLLEEHTANETLERIVVYNCLYNVETDNLTVSGFARRYGYDAFGIAFINNEPVTVDEQFIFGMKTGIRQGLQLPLENAPVETNESAE